MLFNALDGMHAKDKSAELKQEEKVHIYAKPNFGTNAEAEETKEEHYEQIQITVDENFYDPKNPDEFIETDVEDILNE